MAALDFPNSPAYGETYDKYKWDGEKWCLAVGGRPKAATTPPTILTGIVGWWDASVTASLNLTGANVNSIADQSASARTLSKSGNNFPLYSATGFNTSYPAITTVSTSQSSLQGSSIPLGTGNTLTLWYVGTLLNFANGSYSDARLFSYRSTGGPNDYDNAGSFLLYSNSGSLTNIRFHRNGVTLLSSAVAASPAGHRIIITVNSSGGITMYIDGVSVGTATSAGNWANNGDFCIGAQAAQVTQYGSWTFGEAGIATGFADATAVAALDNYLANKWGLGPAAMFLARTSGLDTTHINAYTDLINGLVTDGIWSKLDVLHVYATQNSTTALLNLVSTSYNGTVGGSPVFTADRGYMGATGSNYIYPGFDPWSVASKYVSASAHISAWSLTDSNSSTAVMGVWDDTYGNDTSIYPRHADGNFYGRVNSDHIAGVAVADSLGHFVATRTNSTTVSTYKSGVNVLTNTAATPMATLSGRSPFILALNNSGSIQGSPRQLAMASMGAGLTAGDVANFYARLRTYMTAVGVP